MFLRSQTREKCYMIFQALSQFHSHNIITQQLLFFHLLVSLLKRVSKLHL